jgi:hypothetical protein
LIAFSGDRCGGEADGRDNSPNPQALVQVQKIDQIIGGGGDV